jgi:hypothetical protein
MRNLGRQMEMLQKLLEAVKCREKLKKYSVKCKIAIFDQERFEKTSKKGEVVLSGFEIIEVSKNLRNSIKLSDFHQHSIPIQPPKVADRLILPTELPGNKRPRPEIQKKTDLSFDVALICCRLISEGDKLKLWPLIDPKRNEINESNHINSHSIQLQNEEKLKMRGRVMRGSKNIAIDRLIMNDCEYTWGRYMGLSGNWHNLESELHNDFYDDEDNEAFQRLHKLVTQGYRNFSKFRAH